MPNGVSLDDELQRLAEENAALRAENEQLSAAAQEPPARKTSGWRWFLTAVLLTMGGVALIGAVAAIWTSNLLLDTDRYTETVAPLADEPAIQRSVSVAAVDELFSRAEVEERAQRALPPEAAFLAPGLESELRGVALNWSQQALDSQQFRTLWVEGNRRFHQALVPVLTGQQGPRGVVDTADGTVSLDISAVVARVKANLVDRGLTVFEQVPDDALGGRLVLVQSDRLEQIQSAVQLLQQLAVALPLLALALIAAGAFAAPDRRKGLMWVGVTVVIAMVALGSVLGLARTYYIESADRLIFTSEAAGVFYDTMVRFLRDGLRVVASLGVILVVGAALAGPSRVAVAFRRGTMSGLSAAAAAAGWDIERVSAWVSRWRWLLDFSILVILTVVLLGAATVTPSLVLGSAIIALIAVLLVEVIARSAPSARAPDRPVTM